jgi:hypothetical protein
MLASRHSTTGATLPALLNLVIFEVGSDFIPRSAWITILLFVHPLIAGMTGAHHYAQTFVEMGYQELFAQAGLEPKYS